MFKFDDIAAQVAAQDKKCRDTLISQEECRAAHRARFRANDMTKDDFLKGQSESIKKLRDDVDELYRLESEWARASESEEE